MCRQKTDKRRLTRIVFTQSVSTTENQVVIDKTGKQNGRGAYVCDQPACWQKLVQTPGILNQALKTQVSSEDLEEIARHTPETAVAPNI
ncbi:MAG: YlxR family protein [Chloroflexi bacterium]|nr:YlxR family protein [Chloroflexota bacterium]